MRYLVALLLALTITPVAAEHYLETIDGDTFKTNERTIHLYGIDAPEIDQPHGKEAMWVLRGRLKRGTLSLRTVGTTPEGEAIARVVVDGENLSHKLLTYGLAWIKPGDETPELRRMVDVACATRRGLWHDNETITPWAYRLGGRKPHTITRPKIDLPKQAPSTPSGFHWSKRASTGITVYVTEYGNRYHRGNCGHLRSSRQATSLESAAQAHEPCSHCRPPTLNR